MGLRSILNAESVAIVGASRSETKRGYQAIRTLLEEKYEGRIYPVNPKEKSILGLPCYKRVQDIEENVDMALITTPAKTIPAVLEDCGKKGVSGVVIIAGGFREIGGKGKELENETKKMAEKYNIRMIGPNTSGMINLHQHLNLVGLRDIPKGEIALLSQSGNMALTLMTEAKLKSNKGFSYYVGVGNEADIKFHEYLKFFHEDPKTSAIVLYVEGLRQGRNFLQQAYQTTLKKPIIVLKGGRSQTGKKTAGSHTGALAGISEVARTAFQRAGIIVVQNSDELFPVAETLSCLPPIKNNSVAILADGGGHATIAADLLSDYGIRMPELSENAQKKLRRILPEAANVRNPIDVAGGTDADPTIFADCAEIILKDPNIGGLLIVGLFGGYGIRFAESLGLKEEDAAHRMGKLVQKKKKPIVVHSLYTTVKPHPLKLLQYYNLTVYDSLDVATKCIGALAEYGEFINSYHPKANFVMNLRHKAKVEGVKIIQKARKQGRNILLETEAKKLIKMHGAPVLEEVLATTPDEAWNAAKKLGKPVAMKIVSPDILHKSEAKGVLLNRKTEDEVKNGFNFILDAVKSYKQDAEITGIMITPMAEKGEEIIIGTKNDDQFGPIIMFGLGGVMVEVVKDVSFRVLPISERSARRMIRDIKSYPILDKFRGRPALDQQAIKQLLLTCSELVESYPEIWEMDLNPTIVHEKGLTVVDARIILRDVQ